MRDFEIVLRLGTKSETKRQRHVRRGWGLTCGLCRGQVSVVHWRDDGGEVEEKAKCHHPSQGPSWPRLLTTDTRLTHLPQSYTWCQCSAAIHTLIHSSTLTQTSPVHLKHNTRKIVFKIHHQEYEQAKWKENKKPHIIYKMKTPNCYKCLNIRN